MLCVDTFICTGWLHTKDIGYYDKKGEIFFVDRISDFINYKSINLSPAEIEGVLEFHPSVLKAVVVPVPHKTDVELPLAFVQKVAGKEVRGITQYNYVYYHTSICMCVLISH